MIRRNQRLLNMLNVLSDGVILTLTYLVSCWLWLYVMKNDYGNMATSSFGPALIYAACIVLMLAVSRIYNPSRIRRIREDLLIILRANGIGCLAVGTILFVIRLEDFSRGVLLVFFVISSLALCAKRVALRMTLNHIRARQINLKHVIVVGTGKLARQYAQSVADEPNFGFNVVGFVGAGQDDLNMLGDFDSLHEHIAGTGIDEVVIALEPEESAQVASLIAECERCGTKVSIIPFYNDFIPGCATFEKIGSTKLINLRSNPLDNVGYAAIKRGFDVVASLLLIIITSPLMLIAAVGIRLTSPGPILFRQERVGRNKKPFTMLKFRTMHVNKSQETGWTTDADPRKTRFGSLLRKCSIDELPQLINVLRGDMSLIGPRPEMPFFVEKYRDKVSLYMVKHQVRPGITGWAQVNGYRGDTSIDRRIEHDIYYIENWSIAMDLLILWKTFWGGWINSEKVQKKKDIAA